MHSNPTMFIWSPTMAIGQGQFAVIHPFFSLFYPLSRQKCQGKEGQRIIFFKKHKPLATFPLNISKQKRLSCRKYTWPNKLEENLWPNNMEFLFNSINPIIRWSWPNVWINANYSDIYRYSQKGNHTNSRRKLLAVSWAS